LVRLNRLASVENNLPDDATPHNDRIEVTIAQTRAGIECTGSRGLKHLQAARERREFRESFRKPEEMKPDTFNPASYCRNAPEFVMTADSFTVLTRLPPNQPLDFPAHPEPVAA